MNPGPVIMLAVVLGIAACTETGAVPVPNPSTSPAIEARLERIERLLVDRAMYESKMFQLDAEYTACNDVCAKEFDARMKKYKNLAYLRCLDTDGEGDGPDEFFGGDVERYCRAKGPWDYKDIGVEFELENEKRDCSKKCNKMPRSPVLRNLGC